MRSFENSVISPAVVIVDGISVGYTIGETILEHSIDTIMKEDINSLLYSKALKSAEKGSISFNVNEATLENLQFIYETSQDIKSFGNQEYLNVGGDINIVEHEIILYCMAPNKKLRKIKLFKCIRTGNMTYPLKREDKSVFPLKYKLLGKLEYPIGKQLFQILDFTTIDYSLTYGLETGL